MALNPDRAIHRLEALKTGRSNFDGHWEEVRKVTYPGASEFTATTVRGAKLHKDVFDGSAEITNEMLASALFGMVTNPATKWMGLVTADRDLMRDQDVGAWLEHATRRMLAMFNAPDTNFAPQQFLKLLDFVAFGTGPQFIAERSSGRPLFQTAMLSQCYIAENDDGMVDTVYRVYPRTAAQLARRYGVGALPKRVQQMAGDERHMDDYVDCLHLVEPREGGAVGRDTANKPFGEAYLVIQDKHMLAESGYDEFPWVVPRMNPRPGEVYGRGRGMTALADSKMLQRSMKSTIRAAEKRTDPPIQVPDDGVMSPIRMTPSGINVVRADLLSRTGGGIRPLDTGADPGVGEAFSDSIRQRIDRAYWLPILQAFADRLERDPRMTATVGLKLDRETLRFLGPILGRLQSEDLGPMIERVFPLMLRGGQFEPPPPALEGQRIEVEYESPVAKAQRLEEAGGLAETLELTAPLIGSKPHILDNLDEDKAFRGIAELRSVPADWLRDEKAVAVIRDARNRAAQQQQVADMVAEQAPAAAGALKDVVEAGRAANENQEAA